MTTPVSIRATANAPAHCRMTALPRPRFPGRRAPTPWRRGLLLLLVLALAAMLSGQARSAPALRLASATPDASQAVHTLTHARLVSAAGVKDVVLPHTLGPEDFKPEGSLVRYHLRLDLAQRPREPLGIFVSKVSLGAQLYLNGQWAGACALGAMELLRCLHRPWLASPPPALWQAGANEVVIEVHANERQTNGLSVVRVGPLQTLSKGAYAQQYRLQVLLLQALTWTTVVLGLLSLMAALYLPGRSLYLWAGLASLAHALSNINFLTPVAWPTVEVYSWFAFSSRMSSSSLLMMACIAFYGQDRAWQRWLAAGYALVIPVVIWFSENDRLLAVMLGGPLLACGTLVMLSMLRWTWRSRQFTHGLMLAAALVMLAAAFSDWQRLRGASAFEGVYLLAYASASFLAVMGGLVLTELATALRRSRELTATLESQVAEREQRLAHSYAQRLQYERTEAVHQERERLLADMHDSLGSGLSTAHLLLRQGQLSAGEAAYLVQECMDDLRLVFDVSANLDQDLATLAADVRHRLEGRLAGVGLHTHWVIEVQGMPALDSTRSLQLMRILQEAVTNAVRHAGASHLQISLRWHAEARQLCLQVRDDGQGLSAHKQSTGRGLANMARRAAMVGGELDIRPAQPGTLVECRLQL